MRLLLGALLLAAGALSGGWAAAQGYPSSVKALVAQTKAEVRTIDMAAPGIRS